MTAKIAYYYFSYCAVAFILAILVTPVMRGLAFYLGAVDRGAGRRTHTGIVPRLGGIGIFIAYAVPFLFAQTRGLWDEMHYRTLGIFLASAIVLFIGIYDDIRGATIVNKLVSQCMAALFIYAWGIRIEVLSNPFGGVIALGWLSLPVTVLWIVIITNSVNLIDGLDGLAAGTGVLIATTLFFLAADKDVHYKLTLIILAGALLGFLRHNFPPATIFMGDSGSLFLGFFLAAITIASSYKATAMATILLPVLAFIHPLMDMTYAVLRRFYRGLPLGLADREHIHHKLLDRGMSRRRVVLTLYAVNILLMAGILLLVGRQLSYNLIWLVCLAVAVVAGLKFFGYVEFRAFARENIRNFTINRKRRYFNYLIKRFRNGAARSRSLEALAPPLDELMGEYGFSRAEIALDGTVVYRYEGKGRESRPMSLEFPVVSGQAAIGRVRLDKEMDDDYFLCTAELARALSECIAGVMDRVASGRDRAADGEGQDGNAGHGAD